jgi:hypothetical protein
MTIAERIADRYTQDLDLGNLTTLQCWVLHGIKTVALGDWARVELARLKSGAAL